MGYDRYPPTWSQERFPSSYLSTVKVSKRSRTLVIIVAAFCCTYFLTNFITSLPFRNLPNHDFSSNPGFAKSDSHDHHEHHVTIDGHAAVLSEVNEEIAINEFAGAKIGKISMLYGDPNPTYERALQSHVNHGHTHHYPMFVLRQKLLGRLWSKPAYIMSIILKELQKPDRRDRLEWLFWFDADTYLINQKIPLEAFLPPNPDFSHINFLCGNDHNGLNDGAFLMRVNDWTLHLMAAAISVETFRPGVNLKYSEQSAIEHLVKHEPIYINHTAIIPQRWYNAFMGPREWDGKIKPNKQITGNSVQEGDMLVHFAGSGDTKKGRMTRFMNAYEKNRAMWELELAETEYEAEIREFWEEWGRFEKERAEKGLPMPATAAKQHGGGLGGRERSGKELKEDKKATQLAQAQLEEGPRGRRS